PWRKVGWVVPLQPSEGMHMGKARRRGSGEGTITQREDGRWMGQLSLGFDPVTGRRQRETVYGDTQAEVRQKLDEMKQHHHSGGLLVESKIPLKRFLDLWLDGQKDAVAEKSYDLYAANAADLAHYLGTRPVSQLTAADVTRMYRRAEE